MEKEIVIKNNLPDPETISPELNKEIKDFIKKIFETKGRLEFYDASEYFTLKLQEKDLPRAMITGYYLNNMIMWSKKSDKEKMELMDGIMRDIKELEHTLEEEILQEV